MEKLLEEIKRCVACKKQLPNEPKPILQASVHSSIVIIGQAPGRKVQNSGIPWDDLSGKELRRWLGVSKELFYDPAHFALIPMGFCYPGKGLSGDLPPRPECAPLWHKSLLAELKRVRLVILVGQYAQKHYLAEKLYPTLTETVRRFRDFLPLYLPLVHPSPRNKIWHKRNPWFEIEVVPYLQKIVSESMPDRINDHI
jgi:uracil-DNA glycosylase